ncbi:MAG: hypothetical protein M1360_03535 [Candidatus Marsarchaeota archaeon]|jgi:hypothetical protein|nr:hypothetical protein [Candidatus Marsarchaeota archaeon]MCL5418985.1 hypothetical protein [Candidatus Marsarchaeota archaeon]
MFGGNKGSDTSNSENRKSYSIVLTERDKKVLYVLFAVVLFAVAAILLAVSSQRKSALQECNSILLSQSRSNCIANLAAHTGNATICSFLPVESQRYACVLGIASAKGSIALCNYINSTQYYEECAYNVANSTSNLSACRTLEEPYKSECIYSYSKSTNFSDLGLCQEISNPALSSECSYSYYYRSALQYRNQSYCSYLPNTVNSTDISYLLPQNANYSIEAGLEFASLNITPMQYCYLQLANETRNSSLCSFTTGIANYVCKGIFTAHNATNVTVNESAVCNSVPSALKSICEYSYQSSKALEEDNVSQCLGIGNETYKDNCIYTLAYRYNQSSYCGYITNATSQSACYSGVR